MRKTFRIHGDNIVECERIAKLILYEIKCKDIKISLMSPSTLVYKLDFEYLNKSYKFELELLPGFNKAGRKRWERDIFTVLKNNGSFLDETPDAIITCVENGIEKILFAIEFCSALQAGNQAWQRSGRAFSTGRTGCPYIYIVDFVKYELDSRTRKRKILRFPNPAVPYSYINFSKEINNFVAQVYVRSEEFDKKLDDDLKNFDEKNFAEEELSRYIVKKMCCLDTSAEEKAILEKNLNVVLFLANKSRQTTNFTKEQWLKLYNSRQGIIPFALKNSSFHFRKTITAKGHHGNSQDFLDMVEELSVGLASRDLPFGLIPASNRKILAHRLHLLYPDYNINIINRIASSTSDLVICMIKGFKPRGDDNRPDRGILPLAVMLSSTDVEIMTYIYGPVIEHNFEELISKPKHLAKTNGLWKAILALSDYVALDVPILANNNYDEKVILDTSETKKYYTTQDVKDETLSQNSFSSTPTSYHEDDVDTGIHFLFYHLLNDVCFEGMCNPPGGDWSGLSLISENHEVRWLSLPRVSKEVDGKRPDHVLELFGVFDKPLLLSIESKERSMDLEENVGNGLVNYICSLMDFIPNVERSAGQNSATNWKQSKQYTDKNQFKIISAAAYLRQYAQNNNVVFSNSNCDMLFIMEPSNCGWKIEIVTSNSDSKTLKTFICNKVKKSDYNNIIIF